MFSVHIRIPITQFRNLEPEKAGEIGIWCRELIFAPMWKLYIMQSFGRPSDEMRNELTRRHTITHKSSLGKLTERGILDRVASLAILSRRNTGLSRAALILSLVEADNDGARESIFMCHSYPYLISRDSSLTKDDVIH